MNEMILIRWLGRTSVSTWLIMFGLAFALMSPFGLQVFTLGERFFVEVPLVALFLIAAVSCPNFIKNLTVGLSRWQSVLILTLIAIFGILGFLRHGDAVAIYGDVRASFIFVLTYVLLNEYYSRNARSEDVDLFILCTSLIAGALTVLHYKAGLSGAYFEDKQSLPFFASAVSLIIATWFRMWILSALSLVLLVYVSIQSGFRMALVVSTFAFFIAVLTVILRVKAEGEGRALNATFSVCAAALLLLPLGFLAKGRIQAYWDDQLHAGRRYQEVIGKTENLLSFNRGDSDLNMSDMQRMDYYRDLVTNPSLYVFPRGLGSRINEEVDGSRFVLGFIGTGDSAFYFIAYHFGLPSLVLLSGLISIWIVRRLPKLPWTRIILLLVSFLLVCAYGAVSAEMLTVIPKAIPFVFFLAFVERRFGGARTPKGQRTDFAGARQRKHC